MQIKPRDLDILERVHRHGSLSLLDIHAYYPEVTYDVIRKVVYRMVNTPAQRPYDAPLLRIAPGHKPKTSVVDTNFGVVELTEVGKLVLIDHGRWHERAPGHHGVNYFHDRLCAQITIWLELACLRQPDKYQYRFHDEIMEHTTGEFWVGNYEQKKKLKKPNLVPDVFGGVRFLGDDTKVTFVIEGDRGTEGHTLAARKKTTQSNAKIYNDWIASEQYQKDLDIDSGLVVMIVTVIPPRVQNMMKSAATFLTDENAQRGVVFKYIPGFAPIYKPQRFDPEFFSGAWHRIGQPPYFIP